MPMPKFSFLSKVTFRFTFDCMHFTLRACRCHRWPHHHCRVSFAEKPQRDIPSFRCFLYPLVHHYLTYLPDSHMQSVLRQVLDGVGDAAMPGFAVQAQ